ncbi:MAG: arsenate reductase ArsC [Anaerolineae bacterium]
MFNDPRGKKRVLFLCTGNSARSQMAEALLRHYAGDIFEVYSAGLEPKGINPFSIRAMDEVGIDIRGQRSKDTTEYMGRVLFHYVITVCGNADKSCPQALWDQWGQKIHWPFEDPAAATGTDDEIMATFRTVRDQIDGRIKAWLKELEVEAVSK